MTMWCCDSRCKTWPGNRHCLMFLGLCGLAICYIMRISPGITIISMIDDNNSTYFAKNGSLGPKKFHWSPMDQNTILSSFFYSYFMMQLPAGWVTQHVGGKWTFAAGVSFCGLIALILPKSVELGGFTCFLLLRITQGLFQGLCYPSLHRLAGSWYPPREYACLSGVMHSGYIVGTVLAMVCSGYVIDANLFGGWPSPFYLSGILAFIWLPVWLIFISETPRSHPWISLDEVFYIETSLRHTRNTHPSSIPWRRFATSGQVWLIMLCYVLDGWANYTLLVCVPQFMNDVLNVPISENGVLSALPYIAALVFMYTITAVDGYILRRRWISMPNSRKMWSGLSSFGKSLLLLVIAYLDASRKKTIIVLLVLNVMLSSATLLGFNLADLDLAPAYAGFLFSVFNACSTFSGIVAPLVVGSFTSAYPPETAWKNIFVLASAISFLCGFLFVLFGRQAPLPWIEQQVSQRLDCSRTSVTQSPHSETSSDSRVRLLDDVS